MVEKHAYGFVACPLGLKGVVLGGGPVGWYFAGLARAAGLKSVILSEPVAYWAEVGQKERLHPGFGVGVLSFGHHIIH